jgi:iron complex outermembrane receptor protein
LRGVGSDAFLMADPSVASYVDGIYFPFAQGLSQDFGAVERVEVLKGPQGTLFGRNAVGGAINVLTRNPDFSEVKTSVQAGYGNRNALDARAYTNIPLSDSLALNLSAFYDLSDPYMKGTAGGKPIDEERARGARIKLRWAPTEQLDLILAGLRLQQYGSGSVFQLNASPSLLVGSLLLQIPAQTGYRGALSEAANLRFDNTVIYGQGSYETPWFDVKLLGSNQSATSRFFYDFDGANIDAAAFDQKKNFAEIETAEFQILSNEGSWGAEHFQWIAGAYYFHSKQGFDTANLGLLGLDLADFQDGGISLPQFAIDALNQLELYFPNGDIAFHAITGTLSRSAFAQGTVKFTDWLSLTLGGRYQDEERYIVRSDSGLYLSNGGFAPLFNWNVIGARDGDGNPVPIHDTTTSFKPKATLELRPFGGDTLIYFTYQEAEKSATYNTVAIYQRPAYVKPEELDAYELGLKTSAFDGNLALSLAAFDYDIRNFQVQFISLLQGGAVSFENADAASIHGVDFDATVRVLPSLFDGLVATFAAAWLDGEYDKYVSASGFHPVTGLFSSNNDYSGNRVVRTPKYSGSAALTKTWNLGSGQLEIGGDVYYNYGFFYAASNAGNLAQDAYTLLGARLGYLYAPWGLRATLFGRNLTDKQYSQGLIATDFGANYTLAPPLTYGLRLNWDF